MATSSNTRVNLRSPIEIGFEDEVDYDRLRGVEPSDVRLF